jgi:hypothetical protein
MNAKQLGALGEENSDESSMEQLREKRRVARETGANWGHYRQFFFSTEAVSPASCLESGDNGGVGTTQIARSSQSGVLPGMLEELLPFYSESSVHLRELVHDRAADQSWSWRRNGADLVFCAGASAGAADGGGASLGVGVASPFKSTVPALFTAGPIDSAMVTDFLVIVIFLSLIVSVIVWLVRFALHKVFVVDVIEPLWSGSSRSPSPMWGPNLFLVSGTPMADRLQASAYTGVDLACAPEDRSEQSRWFDEQLDRLAQSAPGQNVLMLHFEHRLADPAFSELKLSLLERVMAALDRTIVIVSAVPPGRFTAARAAAVPADPDATEAARGMRRWADVLAKFTIVPVAPAPPPFEPASATPLADWMTLGWREILWRINTLGFAHSTRFLDDERRDAVVDRFWKDVLPYAWLPDRPALDLNQLLTEVGERSENHYREIWESCTPAEKLVLGQIAEEGLVNQKTVRTVRMLMARGLVRRQPNFVVMNETFRQFLLSPSLRAEVAAFEGNATSTWDAIRWPFMVLLVGSLTFFFATQHELFNSALGIVTGITAALPAVVKMASLFGDRKQA